MTRFVFAFIGAGVFWIAKGMKGKFDDEMTGYVERSSKYYRNLLTGLAVCSVIAFILIKVLDR